jgi:hypothetical protein
MEQLRRAGVGAWDGEAEKNSETSRGGMDQPTSHSVSTRFSIVIVLQSISGGLDLADPRERAMTQAWWRDKRRCFCTTRLHQMGGVV